MRRERRGERERGVKMEMGSKPELRMDLGAVYVPNDVSGFLREVAKVGEISEKLSKLEDYVRRLEDELRKVDAFRRELPLCMLLLNDAIVRVKEEAMQCRESEDRSVMEEFMPLKANSDEDEDGGLKVAEDCKDKKHWMSSAQLWNSKHSILQLKLKQECEEDNETPYQQCDYRNKGGAIVPFRGNSGFPATALTDGREREVPDLSLMTPGIKTPISEVGSLNLSSNSCSRSGLSGSSSATEQTKTQQQNTFRKHRRCWSPELHRRFVDALQRLGGWQGFSGYCSVYFGWEMAQMGIAELGRELNESAQRGNSQVPFLCVLHCGSENGEPKSSENYNFSLNIGIKMFMNFPTTKIHL
ncbi:transcription factor HHO5-like isoform X2 [Malania oleifera]|uniref:transcription factor HHO5-like isoform X2 n=1 Tax=Malania oleifera TaxID=397392 RepID=UPI0025AE8D28|nr:transcription factor HHO5-like isoform X2 [Malania oleifera]